MQENLKGALRWIRANEGGFAVRAGEPGGGVNKGVSLLVLQEYRGRRGLPWPLMDDLRALTDEEADDVYTSKYADPIHFDELPSGLDMALLDVAVMDGVRGSLLLLQNALGLNVLTGVWDARTADAVAASDVKSLIAKLTIHQMRLKMQSKSVVMFGRGWGDRIVRRYVKALEMVDDVAARQIQPA